MPGERSVVWAFGPMEPELLDDVRATGATVIAHDRDPMVELIEAQRLAVAIARARELDPDNPRRLARSVVLR